jgi:hypothetical protein
MFSLVSYLDSIDIAHLGEILPESSLLLQFILKIAEE